MTLAFNMLQCIEFRNKLQDFQSRIIAFLMKIVIFYRHQNKQKNYDIPATLATTSIRKHLNTTTWCNKVV